MQTAHESMLLLLVLVLLELFTVVWLTKKKFARHDKIIYMLLALNLSEKDIYKRRGFTCMLTAMPRQPWRMAVRTASGLPKLRRARVLPCSGGLAAAGVTGKPVGVRR
jgi:hypothetical protein